ncbi:MAG: hypothetical protein M1827_005305 [Pycnora praestabilis]|nr:MAG: hypothetical protein M1827_005305 [Pycnora praestabilis]
MGGAGCQASAAIAKQSVNSELDVTIALNVGNDIKIDKVIEQEPSVSISLRPIAPPAALGLAGFASSTFITSTWIANWWVSPNSPNIFFPFVAFFGALAQFLAGFKGYDARDTLVTVINVMWGSFRMSIGSLYPVAVTGALPLHGIYEHFPELALWFVVLAFFTWLGAIASTSQDIVLVGVLFYLLSVRPSHALFLRTVTVPTLVSKSPPISRF